MNSRPDLKFRRTLENIRLYFDFLFTRGFRLVSVLFADAQNENWQVTLMDNRYLINIYSEQGVVALNAGYLQQNNEVDFLDLEDMKRLVHSEEIFHIPGDFLSTEVQQFKRIAHFFEKYYAPILAQIEIQNLPALNLPAHKSSTQQKRTII